jgi:AcrR family transcriptional regulator
MPAHNVPNPAMSAVSSATAPRRRDAAVTKEAILKAGCAEFSQHGLTGARIDRIANRSGCNIRMIYHYYGSKEGLYIAVLEDTYRRIRSLERQLDLAHMDPVEGMRKLVDFTFTYLLENPDFASLIRNENLQEGAYLRKSRVVPETTLPLLTALENLLARGRAGGQFPRLVDPVQLYVTILSLCLTHLSNRHTLSIMFQRDLAAREWLEARREHAIEVVITYLTRP